MERPIQKSFTTQQIAFFILLTLFTTVFCISYSTNSFAAAGDELIVIESLVNVRSGPSGDSEPIARLKQDRIVIEIQRKNKWVEVEINGDKIKTGWIHKTLLRNVNATPNTSSPTRFDNFMQRFNDHTEVINNQNGTIYFSEAKRKNNTEIEVIATQAWLDSNMETRNNSLSDIFKLWSDVVPVGTSISVHVLDKDGERYTVMLR